MNPVEQAKRREDLVLAKFERYKTKVGDPTVAAQLTVASEISDLSADVLGIPTALTSLVNTVRAGAQQISSK